MQLLAAMAPPSGGRNPFSQRIQVGTSQMLVSKALIDGRGMACTRLLESLDCLLSMASGSQSMQLLGRDRLVMAFQLVPLPLGKV